MATLTERPTTAPVEQALFGRRGGIGTTLYDYYDAEWKKLEAEALAKGLDLPEFNTYDMALAKTNTHPLMQQLRKALGKNVVLTDTGTSEGNWKYQVKESSLLDISPNMMSPGFTEVPTAMGPPLLLMQNSEESLSPREKAVLGGALGVGAGSIFAELASRKIKSRLGSLIDRLPTRASRRGAALTGLAALGALLGLEIL